ncbi:hypothetical protein MKW94_020389, partial [Papaver nudicaule]|nr:hypothetical protein [Papaver nudicaule]
IYMLCFNTNQTKQPPYMLCFNTLLKTHFTGVEGPARQRPLVMLQQPSISSNTNHFFSLHVQ